MSLWSQCIVHVCHEDFKFHVKYKYLYNCMYIFPFKWHKQCLYCERVVGLNAIRSLADIRIIINMYMNACMYLPMYMYMYIAVGWVWFFCVVSLSTVSDGWVCIIYESLSCAPYVHNLDHTLFFILINITRSIGRVLLQLLLHFASCHHYWPGRAYVLDMYMYVCTCIYVRT